MQNIIVIIVFIAIFMVVKGMTGSGEGGDGGSGFTDSNQTSVTANQVDEMTRDYEGLKKWARIENRSAGHVEDGIRFDKAIAEPGKMVLKYTVLSVDASVVDGTMQQQIEKELDKVAPDYFCKDPIPKAALNNGIKVKMKMYGKNGGYIIGYSVDQGICS